MTVRLGWTDSFICLLSPRPSARVLIGMCISILVSWCGRATRCAHAHSSICFCEYDFLLAICFKQECTAINGRNETTPESHECKWQCRLQKLREQWRRWLACEKKEQCQRRLQLRVIRLQLCQEAQKCREQSRCGLKKQARNHRSDSKLNGRWAPADVSIKQPNKRLAGCWIKAKVMLAVMKQQQRHNQRQSTSNITSSSETMLARTSKVWKWGPCSQTLKGNFLSCWKNAFGSKAKLNMSFPVSLSSQQYRLYELNSCLKIHFMLSVLTLGLIFSEEIEPYQFEMPNF